MGRTFDPKVAEAVGSVPCDENRSPYTIVEVVRRGYVLQGNLVRRAAVVTAAPMDGSEK
jgi:molecular chaperone GrpE (heat shock protein)